jgi:hypothetical protein
MVSAVVQASAVLPVVLNDMCARIFLVTLWGAIVAMFFTLYTFSSPLLVVALILLSYGALIVYYKARKSNSIALKEILRRPDNKRSSFADALVKSSRLVSKGPEAVARDTPVLGHMKIHLLEEGSGEDKDIWKHLPHASPRRSSESVLPSIESKTEEKDDEEEEEEEEKKKKKGGVKSAFVSPRKLDPVDPPTVLSPHSLFKINKLPQITPRQSPLKKRSPSSELREGKELHSEEVCDPPGSSVAALTSEIDTFRKDMAKEIEALKKENSSLK